MRKLLFAILFIFIACVSTHAQFAADANSAFELAQETGKSVMLVFSGSDWCAPCIHFEKKILNDREFVSFIDTSLIVLVADFPQAKKLSGEKIEQNERLAEKYNPTGKFPLIVLLRPDETVMAYVKYGNEDSDDFIKLIKKYTLKHYNR